MLQIEVWMLTILQIHHNWHSNGANCPATVWNSCIDTLLHDHNESLYVSRLYNFSKRSSSLPQRPLRQSTDASLRDWHYFRHLLYV